MSRAELLLKCVMTPSEPIQGFVDNYIKLMNDYDLNAFRMILEMKSITKRSDANNYVELFKTRIPQNTTNVASTTNNDNDNNYPQQHETETTNRLKQFDKLQDLIKKKTLLK